MTKIFPFQKYTDRYEQWFDDNPLVYQSELKAVKSLLPEERRGVEVGVGTGRFAAPLGVTLGVEPSGNMRAVAQKRGITVVGGVAEGLPFKDSLFQFVLMVTTICFVDDISTSFEEVLRVLAPGGYFVIGLIDRNSPLGRKYLRSQDANVFYKEATFYGVEDVLTVMKQAGFDDFSFRQTVFSNLSGITEEEPVVSGYGKGSFVVIRAKKR
ncbi:MAG: class I SAM-dependent methyltransferase [Deltaproteobacteria bacterium]|nr:class I SAM-dependent methyltransferase [Deltaproteobacteria bacterium]